MKKQIFWYRQIQFFRVEILGVKLDQTEISKSVLTSIGKVTKKRKSALTKPLAYNF